MALNLNDRYPTRTTPPDSDYPYGSAKDETAEGADDGTPYEKPRADDIFGFQQALLEMAGIVPSGDAETAKNSQYLQALTELVSRATEGVDSGVADAYVVGTKGKNQAPQSLFTGLRVSFNPENDNTGGPVTLDAFGLGAVPVKMKGGSIDPPAGYFRQKVTLVYRTPATPYFEYVAEPYDFGMPVAKKHEGDLDDLKFSGFYWTSSGNPNVPPNFGSTFLIVSRINNNAVLQLAVNWSSTPDPSSMVFRVLYSGVWSDWIGLSGESLSVTSGSNANGYWRLYSDGYLRQWGIVNAKLGGGGSTHSFPLEFGDLASIAGQVSINVDLFFDECIQTYGFDLSTFKVNVNGAGGNLHNVCFGFEGYAATLSVAYNLNRAFVKVGAGDLVSQVFPANQNNLDPSVYEIPLSHPFFGPPGSWLLDTEEAYWDGATVSKRPIP